MVILYYSKGNFIKWEYYDFDNRDKYKKWLCDGNYFIFRGRFADDPDCIKNFLVSGETLGVSTKLKLRPSLDAYGNNMN